MQESILYIAICTYDVRSKDFGTEISQPLAHFLPPVTLWPKQIVWQSRNILSETRGAVPGGLDLGRAAPVAWQEGGFTLSQFCRFPHPICELGSLVKLTLLVSYLTF